MTGLRGEELVREIRETSLAPGEAAFWWLGQLGFVVKLGETVAWLDAYLSDSPARTVPPLVTPRQVCGADLVAGTHDHADHIDRGVWPVIAEASPDATFVVPRRVLDAGLPEQLGIDAGQFVGLDEGLSADIGGIRISAVRSGHEELDVDAEGRSAFLGYILEGNGCRLYHAGDTCRYEGLETTLRGLGPIDVAFLPINGRDAERLRRNCIGNMTYQEAVDLAGAIQPGLTVCGHFEMFAGNSEDPSKFAAYIDVKYPSLAYCVPVHGQRVIIH